MRKLRNFKCESTGFIFERLTDDDRKIVICGCGSEAKRQMSAPRHFGNTCGKSPSGRY